MKNILIPVVIVASMFMCVLSGCAPAVSSDRAVVSTMPANAIVLFDGTNLDKFQGTGGKTVKWKIVDGTLEVAPGTGSILTKELFEDFHMHLEYRIPEGTEKSNSGIYIHRRYEIQIFDSYKKENSPGMCASLYRQKMPDFNVCKAPGQWQSYEIFFRAPRWDGDRKVKNARVTVIHNGVLVHNNVEVTNKTGMGAKEGPNLLGILLQDHGSKIRFRNIWIVKTPNEDNLRVPKEDSHVSFNIN
jgi:hypothetical protein